MRLLGKYAFETLRDCFQGVFEWSHLVDGENHIYMIELWQFRFIIRPLNSLELQFNAGKERGYISFGKINLTN